MLVSVSHYVLIDLLFAIWSYSNTQKSFVSMSTCLTAAASQQRTMITVSSLKSCATRMERVHKLAFVIYSPLNVLCMRLLLFVSFAICALLRTTPAAIVKSGFQSPSECTFVPQLQQHRFCIRFFFVVQIDNYIVCLNSLDISFALSRCLSTNSRVLHSEAKGRMPPIFVMLRVTFFLYH